MPASDVTTTATARIVSDEQRSVSIRVLPFAAGAHPAMGTSYAVLTLPEPPGGEVCCIDELWDARYINRPALVEAYSQVFDSVSRAATKTIGEAAGEVPWMT